MAENTIILNNKKELVVLKISPINFNLKSQLEQKAILEQYKLFLKNLNSKIQIIVSSKKTDLSYHLNEIHKFTNENPQFTELAEDYTYLLKGLIQDVGTVTKDFYIVFEASSNKENEILKVKELLASCGNEVERCSADEIRGLIKNFINKRQMNLL